MLTLSSSNGTGGTVKASPEDFIVREITAKGFALSLNEKYAPAQLGETENKEGKFTTFVLQKRNWETVNALIKIAKLTGRGKKSIAYAGSKDRQSVSVQLASIFGIEPAQIASMNIKDISINGAWKSDGIELGSNIGNAFTVIVRNCVEVDNIERIISELNGKAPNYFDRQRFGLRLNNFAVGMKLLKSDFNGAVMEFLTNTNLETNADAVRARSMLAQNPDFKEALQYFPRYLKPERSVIEYMARYDNYANAMRKLPRGILLMFVHAVQSVIFNASLERRIKDQDFESEINCNKNFYGFPDANAVSAQGEFALGTIVGYDTKPERISEFEKEIMEKLELKTEDFKIKSMPELSLRGSLRTLMMPIKDLSYKTENKDATISFSIPSGSYATILINEVTKSDTLTIREITRPSQVF
ncbi:MAG: tRNA pseudouridine(13) synthase TruD [Candidatus Micrarchaeota archaeon]|nr:tRNA pseudouridine(13) synthase TruD [Candidatus Micrarchaeota archaeon]MDE1834842.1 tRNA pseudouridine(13) synthase TruD [Candidatus Micrarchaeota archaeon]MDE1858915.1 tRNA pseudouridine(13) synthase TruD [Candidatus Micrarchaeota archaeon]